MVLVNNNNSVLNTKNYRPSVIKKKKYKKIK